MCVVSVVSAAVLCADYIIIIIRIIILPILSYFIIIIIRMKNDR